ncbi:hypothetical protein DY000_02041665, partial [Brassica cretica]
MIQRLIPLQRKAFALVQPRFSETGTKRIALFLFSSAFSVLSDGRVSYKERLLTSGIVGIKKDDAVSLFQSMIQSRPLPTIIDFNRLLSEVSRTKQKLGFAFSVMGKMLKLGYDPDTITFSTLINVYVSR